MRSSCKAKSIQDSCSLTLKKNDFYFIDVDSGQLASGLVGFGRMAEPEKIINYLESFFKD